MTGFVLDCSILLAALLPDEHSSRADELVAKLSTVRASVPQHWPLEVANGLLFALRRGRISDGEWRGAITDAESIRADVATDTGALAWSALSVLAKRHDLTIYDAAYLELATRRGLPLATLDGKLAQAARVEGVEVL